MSRKVGGSFSSYQKVSNLEGVKFPRLTNDLIRRVMIANPLIKNLNIKSISIDQNYNAIHLISGIITIYLPFFTIRGNL